MSAATARRLLIAGLAGYVTAIAVGIVSLVL